MAASDRYLYFLGHSIFQEELNAILRAELGMTEIPAPDSIGTTSVANKELGLTFDFHSATSYSSFIHNYGTPKSKLTDDRKEPILAEITFDKLGGCPLPFGIQIGDHEDTLFKKLGVKPFERGRSDEDGKEEYAYRFFVDEYRVLSKLDKDRCLLWLRFWPMSVSEKASIELKKMLSEQNKNIKPENVSVVLSQKSKIPSLVVADDVNEFNPEMGKAFEAYIEQLAEGCSQKKAAKAHTAVKKLVKTLNRFREQIETDERELFVVFIHESLALTGFEVPINADLTEQWREW